MDKSMGNRPCPRLIRVEQVADKTAERAVRNEVALESHENRITRLEGVLLKVAGAALAGSFVGSLVTWKLFLP